MDRDKAIKFIHDLLRMLKAKGGSEENYDELRYEGFGPNGAMVIVDTLTNNVNRTAADVRAAFSKNSGNMGVNGSVAYMFDATAVIGLEGKTSDEVLEILMEADVDARDILEEEDSVIVYAEPDQFHAVQSALKGAGVEEFTVAELTMLAQSDVTLPEDAQAQFRRLIGPGRGESGPWILSGIRFLSLLLPPFYHQSPATSTESRCRLHFSAHQHS